MPTMAEHRGTTAAPQLGSWACLRRPAPPSIPLALLAHPPWGKPRTLLISDLDSPGFEHGPQGTSTGSCPHGDGCGKGHRQHSAEGRAPAVLYVGGGTGSTGNGGGHWGSLWGGGWQCCAQGCPHCPVSLHSLHRRWPSLDQPTRSARAGPMCFWIQSQLLAQERQMEAVLNSSSSAGCTEPHGPNLPWRGSPGREQGSSAYLHSQSAHPGARPSADFVLSAAANDKEESRGH